MNAEKQIAQLKLAAALLETGHPWEYLSPSTGWTISADQYGLCWRIACLFAIRPVLVTPQDGRKIYNPLGLTAEQVGVGYKLTLVEQVLTPVQTEAQYWSEGFQQWVNSNSQLYCAGYCYRIPLSTTYPDPKADTFAELKKAHAAGKVIQISSRYADCFSDCDKGEENWEDCEPQWAENRKYRVKPWTMPEAPAGRQWHKAEALTEQDWEEGLRPYLAGEILERGDPIVYADGGVSTVDGLAGESISTTTLRKALTKRPLPVEPVNPETKWVPLGSEDVPLGSVFRWKSWQCAKDNVCAWVAPLQVTVTCGVLIGSTVPEWKTWDDLESDFEILRPGSTDWHPCRKEVQP